MNRLNYRYFAPLAAMLATLFLLGGCLPDKGKAEARRQERLSREVFAIQGELILSGDTAAAITKLEALNTRHPDHLEIIEALGAAYKEKGDPLMTAFYYDYAFELDPQNADFALQAARAHEANGSSAEALAAYRSYLKLEPAAPGLWRNIALLEMEQDNHQLALTAYLEALRADKVQPAAQDKLNIAVLYHKLGNQPQAQRWYEDLLSERDLERELQVGGMIGLFDLALRQKHWERALELMHEIDRLSPGTLQEGDYASAYTELADWEQQRKAAEAAARAQAEKEKAEKEHAKKELDTTEATTVQTAATAAGSAMADVPAAAAETATAATADPQAAGETTDAVAAGAGGTSTDQTAGTRVEEALGTVTATTAKGSDAAAGTTGESTEGTVAANDIDKDGRIGNPVPEGEGRAAPPVATDTSASAGQATPSVGEAAAPAATQGNAQTLATETAEEVAAAAAQAASAAELAARGKEAFEAEDFTIAAELLERSAKLNPNNGEVLDMLSRASFRTGHFPQAERYAMLATYAEPENVNYRLEYLRAYQRNHPPASMLQQLISAREAFPQDPNVTLALARGYEHIAQRKALAASLYHEYLQMAPDSPLAEDIRQKLLEWEM